MALRFRLSLGTQLLGLLLAFGAIPLAIAIGVGYVVSRNALIEQGERALRELGDRQATHIRTELTRQRLLLRTIAVHLGDSSAGRRRSDAELAAILAQNLPEDGVFDGLRLVSDRGDVISSVALRNAEPHWPPGVPAADWNSSDLVMHWEEDEAVAYLIAAQVEGASTARRWLEGHVRAADFARLFALPAHFMGDVESGVLDRQGRLVAVGHEHARAVFEREFNRVLSGSGLEVHRLTAAGTPSLVVTAPIRDTDWVFAAVLSVEAAIAPVAQLRNGAVLGAGLLVLIIGLTAVLSARFVGAPMRRLAAAALRFGRGESYHPVEGSGPAEVTRLVESFNQMAGDLQRSRERIEELHAEEMERAHQLATVGELASGVAHEIRNPLTGVLGALDLAVRRLAPGDPARPLLEEAQLQLKRIGTTTEQLLSYARPPVLREVVVDPHNLVERAARLVEMQASASGVDVAVERCHERVAVRVDPELMVQVLVNLMLNGIQAMQEDGKLTVWLAAHPPELWLGVRDTGPGIPPSERASVFRPFYTTKNQGTGLGLPISRQIVERHGGSLRIEETPGGGATFIVALPLAAEDGGSSG